jgi:hypothetical protein
MNFLRASVKIFLIYCLAMPYAVYGESIDTTGAGLLRDCELFLDSTKNGNVITRLTDAQRSGRCLGNADMVFTALRFLDTDPDKRLLCLPSNVTLSEVIRITVKYIEDNPKMMHEPRSNVMTIAVGSAYKC